MKDPGNLYCVQCDKYFGTGRGVKAEAGRAEAHRKETGHLLLSGRAAARQSAGQKLSRIFASLRTEKRTQR